MGVAASNRLWRAAGTETAEPVVAVRIRVDWEGTHLFVAHVVVGIEETESGFEIRGVEPNLRDVPAGAH